MELQKLKKTAENMLYKFKSFEHLKDLQFDRKISSFHHFQSKNVDYIIVNFETRDLQIYTVKGFKLVAFVQDVGAINQYITLNYKDEVYFVTFGKPDSLRNSGNIWTFRNNNFQVSSL